MPNEARLLEIQKSVLLCSEDANPLVFWEGAEVRRYRDNIYAMPPIEPFDIKIELKWETSSPLELPASLGVLMVDDYPQLKKHQTVFVKFRHGGEKIKMPGREGHHSLKNCFQEWGIPPWCRDKIPLIYVEDKLICIGTLEN